MKRHLLLITAMLFSIASVFAQGGTTGPLTWNLSSGTLTITVTSGGTGAMPDYEFEGTPWWEYRESIHAVVIGTGVIHIGNHAFRNSTNLTSTIMPSSVTSIGEAAFYYCTTLTSITIPSNVTSIGAWAFHYCASLTSISIPNSVTDIGEGAFVTCQKLTSIDVESENSTYTSENGVLFNKNKTTLICCPAGKTGTYDIPNSVIRIETCAFYSCINLTFITIPNSVTRIEDRAFTSTNLTSITIPSSVTFIGNNAFSWCGSMSLVTNLNLVPIEIDFSVFNYFNTNTCTLKVPTSAVSAYQNVAVWNIFENIIGSGFLVNPKVNNIEYGYTTGNGLYDVNATVTLTAISFNSNKFINWTKNGVEISTANPYSFTVTEDVELVANFEEGVGIENFELTTLKIYPNPTTGMLKIESNGLRVENVVIYDVFGKIQKIENWKTESTIDISHLQAGAYFVKISTEVGKVSRKVLKE